MNTASDAASMVANPALARRLAAMTDAACAATPDGAVRAANSAFAALAVDASATRELRDLVHPDDAPRLDAALAQLRDGAAVVGCEARLRDAVGRWRPLAWSLALVDGAVFASARDAGGAAAAALRRLEGELEQFAYGASHDLQEPLRMVSNYVHLLQSRYGAALDARAQQYLRFVVEGAGRMQELIRALLEYSRCTRTALDEPVRLGDAVADALEALRAAIAAAGATVAVGELPTVRGERARLAQIVQNLVDNALKFRAVDRACAIAIDARRDGAWWEVSVRDNGIGIEPQHHEHVFDAFKRLHSRDDFPGSGLGLAVCRRLMEARGGRIWVESQPGDGAVFRFAIPA